MQWVSCRFTDGRVIADLPSFEPSYPIRHTLSNWDTAKGRLWLDDKTTPNWQRATLEGGAWIAGYDDDDPAETPQWVGFVVTAKLDATVDAVDVDLATAEAYADRRFIGDVTHSTAEGRNAIVQSTVNSHLLDGAFGRPGMPIRVVMLGGDGPTPAEDLVWQNADNASVLTRWKQLTAQLGGEFTIDWEWTADTDGARVLGAVLRVGDRIGTAAPAGRGPGVTFDMPGPLVTFSELHDYSAGNGANVVTPYSSGQGAGVPYAPDIVAADFHGRGTFEQRYQPAPSISPPTLAQYAQQAAAILAPGSRPVSLGVSLARLEGRRFGQDWILGDDIGWNVANTRADGSPILAFPDGTSGVGRSLAVELTSPTIITPILGVPTVFVAA